MYEAGLLALCVLPAHPSACEQERERKSVVPTTLSQKCVKQPLCALASPVLLCMYVCVMGMERVCVCAYVCVCVCVCVERYV